MTSPVLHSGFKRLETHHAAGFVAHGICEIAPAQVPVWFSVLKEETKFTKDAGWVWGR